MASSPPPATSAGGAQYKGNIADILEAGEDGLAGAIHELVGSITKKDDLGALRWTTQAGQKVARKVLENQDFLRKIIAAVKTMQGSDLADTLLVLTWLATSAKDAIVEIVKPEVLRRLEEVMVVPDRKSSTEKLHPVTHMILVLLERVLCSSRSMWLLGVERSTQSAVMDDLFLCGIIAKVTAIHREIYTRSEHQEERVLPVLILCHLSRKVQFAANLQEMGLVGQLASRLKLCPDDNYAAEFISGIVRSDTVHRELRTADLLAIARKVIHSSNATEVSKLRMVMVVGLIYGRRSESQTFLQTHVMPPDLAALLYAVIGNGDGQNNVPQLLKAVNELLMGRAGYPANAAARDSCKMAAAAVQAIAIHGADTIHSDFVEWMIKTLNDEVVKVENGGECKDLVALMLLLRHIVVFVNWVGHDLLMNKNALRSLMACIPNTFDRDKTSDERIACSASAIFILSVALSHVGKEDCKTAVQAMASVPSIVNRLRMHLLMPGQAYDSLTAGMHLLTHLVESLSSNRGTDAVYCVLHVLYQAPLAKLMAATSGVKSGPLAEQVVSLMDKLLLHANQVNTQYPNSVASKNLNNWSGLLFDLQAIPKVLMILGMTQNTTLLDGGTRVLSHSVDLGYVDRLLAALPVVLARCGHRPDDHYRSLPILKMAMHRELRTTLQEANLAPTLTRWLTSRSGREQMDLLMAMAFVYSGEEEMHNVGRILLDYDITSIVVVIAHAATSSSDNHAKVLGIQWTAKEALNLLHRLTCFPGTAEALLSQNTLPILFAALAKYTAKPAGQQSSTGTDAMASQGAHGPAASVPAPQATAANRPVSGGNPNTPPSSKNPTSKQQTPRDGPSVPTAQVDAEPGPKPGTPPAEPQPSASGTPPTEVGDTAGQAKTPLDDLKPANSHDLHCRPEAVLACRAVVNLCQYFAEDAERMKLTKDMKAALKKASESVDRRLSDAANICMMHLGIHPQDYLGMKAFLSSAQTLCWHPRKEVQFDVVLSYLPTEAQDQAWILMNLLNLQGYRVFANAEPPEHEEDEDMLVDVVHSAPNFVLLLTENTLHDPLCKAQLEAAIEADVEILIVHVEGVRWRDKRNKNILVERPAQAFSNLEYLQGTLLGSYFNYKDMQYDDFLDTVRTRLLPVTDGWENQPLVDWDDFTEYSSSEYTGSESDYSSDGSEYYGYSDDEEVVAEGEEEAAAEEVEGKQEVGMAQRKGARRAKSGPGPRSKSGLGFKADSITRGQPGAQHRRRSKGGPAGRVAGPRGGAIQEQLTGAAGQPGGKLRSRRVSLVGSRTERDKAALAQGKAPRARRGSKAKSEPEAEPDEAAEAEGRKPRARRGIKAKSDREAEADDPPRQGRQARRGAERENSSSPHRQRKERERGGERRERGSRKRRGRRREAKEDEESGRGESLRNFEYRFTAVLEQLPEEVAVLVKQEVELHISALHTELRTQVNEVVGLVRQEFHSVLEELVKHQNTNQTAIEASIRNLQSHVLRVEQHASAATSAASAAARATQELEAHLEALSHGGPPSPATRGASSPTASFRRSPIPAQQQQQQLQGLDPNDPEAMAAMRASGVSPWGEPPSASMAPMYPGAAPAEWRQPGAESSVPHSIVEGTGLPGRAGAGGGGVGLPVGTGTNMLQLPPPTLLPAIGGSYLKGGAAHSSPAPRAAAAALGPNQQRTFINFPSKGRA